MTVDYIQSLEDDQGSINESLGVQERDIEINIKRCDAVDANAYFCKIFYFSVPDFVFFEAGAIFVLVAADPRRLRRRSQPEQKSLPPQKMQNLAPKKKILQKYAFASTASHRLIFFPKFEFCFLGMPSGE